VPIYDYLCSNCRHLTEVIHGINDDGPRFCPSCGAEGTMRKVLSKPTVHFKGSGWAKKDRSSSSGTRTKAAASSSSDATGSDSKADSKAESTTAAASDSATGSADSKASKED
jgi:putative FmdB family regulatory protein